MRKNKDCTKQTHQVLNLQSDSTRLLEEVAKVDKDTMENLNLPITEACLKESMRIKPVGPVVIRRALEADDQLGLAAGDNVVISLEMMHNSESRFPSPSKFNPGNFLDCGSGLMPRDNRFRLYFCTHHFLIQNGKCSPFSRAHSHALTNAMRRHKYF